MAFRHEVLDAHLLVIFGEIVSPEDNTALKDLLQNRPAGGRVILDLAAVPFISTPSLGVLVSLQKTCTEKRLRLILTGLSAYVKEILELTRLARVFEIMPRREDALL